MKHTKLRTTKQNRSLHLMFSQLATELNENGQYIPKVIKLDAPWNAVRIKELIWRPTQKTLFGTTSTTQLTTKQIDQVFEVIHKALANVGIEIVFPSIESLAWKERLK